MNHHKLDDLLQRLSGAFQNRDLTDLLNQFSHTPTVTYAGSETGEIATGPHALQELFRHLLARDASYSFTFPLQRFHQTSGAVWVLADGTGTEHHTTGRTETFPYRITGVLVPHDTQWKWDLLAAAEPTPAS